MKKLITLTLIITMAMTGMVFTACGANSNEAAVEPLTEQDFIVTGNVAEYFENGDLIAYLDNNEKAKSVSLGYDPETDESREGIVETARGIKLGDSKESVISAYGESSDSGEFDAENDFCYEELGGDVYVLEGKETPYQAQMKSESITFARYTMDKYTISFYFDENDEVSWIFFSRS